MRRCETADIDHALLQQRVGDVPVDVAESRAGERLVGGDHRIAAQELRHRIHAGHHLCDVPEILVEEDQVADVHLARAEHRELPVEHRDDARLAPQRVRRSGVAPADHRLALRAPASSPPASRTAARPARSACRCGPTRTAHVRARSAGAARWRPAGRCAGTRLLRGRRECRGCRRSLRSVPARPAAAAPGRRPPASRRTRTAGCRAPSRRRCAPSRRTARRAPRWSAPATAREVPVPRCDGRPAASPRPAGRSRSAGTAGRRRRAGAGGRRSGRCARCRARSSAARTAASRSTSRPCRGW